MAEPAVTGGDTAGTVATFVPPPSRLLLRSSRWLLVVAAAFGIRMLAERWGEADEVRTVVPATAVLVAFLMGLAWFQDRMSRSSELAVLTHGRIRARRRRRERVLEVCPGDSIQLTLDRAGARTEVAVGRKPRDRLTIAGALSYVEAQRFAVALHATVADLSTVIAVSGSSNPWQAARQLARGVRFRRLAKRAEPVIEELAGTGRLKLRVLGLWADRGVIEVGVAGDVHEAETALAERLPMETIRVYEVEGTPQEHARDRMERGGSPRAVPPAATRREVPGTRR